MSATARPGVLLFAHGARDPRWSAPFEAVAAQLRQLRPQVPVQLAYLEFMSPRLPEAAAVLVEAGCDRLDVVPLFLGAGGHVRKDLPALLAEVEQAHPGLRVRLHPAVGEMDSVVQAMALAAVAATEERPA